MRTYDVLFFFAQDVGEEAAQGAVEEYRKLIQESGVTPDADEPWGRRRLAYVIGRQKEAIYHYFRLTCEPKLIAELERRMGLSEIVARHVAVRVDEDIQRQAKADKKKKPRTGPPQPGSMNMSMSSQPPMPEGEGMPPAPGA